jgi:RimJ/RimL family protein N-acetyltransferase
MPGRYCRLEPLSRARHAADLWSALAADVERRNWTYLNHGPYETPEAYAAWVSSVEGGTDPQFYAILAGQSRPMAVGVASYLRIHPAEGSIEVGHINFSPLLQRTPAATEAMFLMMRRVFELGYRRYEWKCHSLNAASRRAAARFGFSYEGVFRQMLVSKGRNRDTAWYACIDKEWPALQAAFEQWLSPDNFDEQGRQRVSLSSLTGPILVARG